MRIKKITIRNFRCYYGDNFFEIGDNLTLIIGANGTGITTFFYALKWLFDTVSKYPKMDTRYISAKRCSELFNDESDFVRVSMTYEDKCCLKRVEKSFRFFKTVKGDVIQSDPMLKLFFIKGGKADCVEGVGASSIFDRDFAASVRKYCLFTGEQKLYSFNEEVVFSYLVESFSHVKDFVPYLEFMEIAQKISERVAYNAMKADKNCLMEAERLRNLISQEEKAVEERITERDYCHERFSHFKTMLDDMEQSKEDSNLYANHLDDWCQLRAVVQKRAVEVEERESILNEEIEFHQALLNEYQDDFSKLAEKSSAAKYFHASKAIRRINDAFVLAKNKNRKDFLYYLEKETNMYFCALNIEGFRCKVQLEEKIDNVVDIYLVDSDGSRILDPYTALNTTMYMSLIFAVAKLTMKLHKKDYPLFFDTPEIAFTGAQKREFFDVIRKFNKQVIIAAYCSEIEIPYYADSKATVYWIEKKRPFSTYDLSSFQTIITKLS